MSLPQITVPTYEITLPSGTEVTHRVFLVKEEKLLLIAREADDPETIVNTVKQVIQNCIVKGPAVDDLPIFDTEYLLLHLRARSTGEVSTLRYRCVNKDTEGKTCGEISEYKINLLEVVPITFPSHTKKIMLTNDIGVMLKYPTMKSFYKILQHGLTSTDIIPVILQCMDSVFDASTVQKTEGVPQEELLNFIESLTAEQLSRMDKFFDTMPKIEHTINFHCPKCGFKQDIVVRGIVDFFG